MTETMPTSEVLNRAADLIEERGWWHVGCSETDAAPGADCAANTIGFAARDQVVGVRIAAWNALIAHLDGSEIADIWRFNDAPGRTAPEVIEVLRACAVIEASRERAAVEVSL